MLDQFRVVGALKAIRLGLRQGLGDGHQKGMACLWTGNQLNPGDFGGGDGGSAGWAGAASIDQAIAQQLGNATAYKSLEFGVQNGGASNWSRMCYAGSDAPIAAENSPEAMFNRLFADLGVDTSELDRIKAERAAAPKTKRGRGNKHTTLETRPSAHGKT